MSDGDATRRQPVEQLGPEGVYGFELDLQLSDLYLLPVGVMAAMLVSFLFAPVSRSMGLVAFALVILVTVAYIFVVRDRGAPHEYLASTLAFWRSEKDISPDADSEDATPAGVTGIERVQTEYDAVQREDGALVGAVDVEASAMSVATDDDWDDALDLYEDHLAGVDYPTTTSVRGEAVSADLLTQGLSERLTDSDVEGIDALEDIIKTHIEQWPVEFDERGACLRQYRVALPVEVADAQLQGNHAVEKLGELSVVGEPIRRLGAELSGRDMNKIRADQAEILSERFKTEVGGLSGLPGVTPRRMTATEQGDAIENYWNNRMTQSTADDMNGESRFEDGVRVRAGSDLDVGREGSR